MSIYEIATYAVFGLLFVLDIVLTIIASKARNSSKKSSILELIPVFTRAANSLFGPKTGQAKLTWVLSQLRAKAAELHIDYDQDQMIADVEYYLGADSTPKKEAFNEEKKNVQEEGPSGLPKNRDEDQKDQRRTHYDARRY